MPKASWGEDAEFFGPRHAFRESLIERSLAPLPPNLHLECAAGLGSLAEKLALRGFRVVAVDSSWTSLRVAQRFRQGKFFTVVADICRLPFRGGTFPSASCAETLEHVTDDGQALAELSRVLQPGGVLIGTVPYDPRQWSAWDEWAGHQRRYELPELGEKLEKAGFQARLQVWGFPTVRFYDALFLKKVNRRRLHLPGPATSDPLLAFFARLARWKGVVALVHALFTLDRFFLGVPWGVGLLFSGTKAKPK